MFRITWDPNSPNEVQVARTAFHHLCEVQGLLAYQGASMIEAFQATLGEVVFRQRPVWSEHLDKET